MKFKFLFLFAFLLSLKGFSQKATSPTEGCFPITVSFEAPSTSATYYWEFGDGSISKDPTPSNIFAKAGNFIVKFRESEGGPVIGTIPVTVYAQSELLISVNPKLACSQAEIKMKSVSKVDPAVDILSYKWSFGDGTGIDGTVDSAKHFYNKIGEYDLFLEIKTEFPTCDKSTIFKNAVKIVNPPVADFVTDPPVPSSCEKTLAVSFTNKSIGEAEMVYSWDLGNGVKSKDLNPASQVYPEGRFLTTLNVFYKDAPACKSYSDKVIFVGKPIAEIYREKDTVCNGARTYFKTNKGNLLWEIDGAFYDPLDAGKDSIPVTFHTPGEHEVKLTVWSYNWLCSDTKTIKIFVDAVTAKIESDPSFACKSPMTILYKGTSNQQNVTYSWRFTDDTTKYKTANVSKSYKSRTDSIYYSINGFEPKIGSLTITSVKTGCSGSAMAIDTLWLPNARFMPDIASGCVPLTVTFSDSSSTFYKNPITSWKWFFGDNNATATKSDSTDVTFTYTKPGDYFARLLVTTKGGCTDTSFAVKIKVGEHLESQLDFSASKSEVCPGETVVIKVDKSPSVVDAYHFTTEGNRMFHCGNQKTVDWTYDNVTGPQTVSLTVDYNGCFSSIEKKSLINVKGAVAKIDYYALCSDPYKYNFESKSLNATNLTWDFGDKTSTSQQAKEIHDFGRSGDFTIRLTASNSDNCPATSDLVTVRPRKVQAKITLSDSLLCNAKKYALSAVNSIDVQADCNTGYTWQFPTMQNKRPYTSSKSSTTFLFDEKGEHFVRLIVKDINGCRDTASVRIKVYDMAVEGKPNRPLLCLPNEVKFADLTKADTTMVKWSWFFGDGSDSLHYTTFIDTTRHTFGDVPNISNMAYSLTVTDILGCKETYSGSLQIYEPITDILTNPVKIVNGEKGICLGTPLTINANDFIAGGSNLTFDWDFGNGKSSNNQSNQILYEASGTYEINLKYKEIISGCNNSAKVTIRVEDYPKARFAAPKMDALAVICAPHAPDFVNLSTDSSDSRITNYLWEPEGWDSWTTPTPSQDWFFDRGEHFVKLTVSTLFGCPSDTTGYFTLYSPAGGFNMTADTICLDEEVKFALSKDTLDVMKFQWNFEGKEITDVDNVTHRFVTHPENGITPAKLTLTSHKGGCTRSVEKNVYIHPVIAAFNRESEPSDTSICFNSGPFHFSNVSMHSDSFKWNFGDGSPEDLINTAPVHQYATPGRYNVSLMVQNNEFGCVDTLTKVALVYPNPKIQASGDTVCQGTELALKVFNPSSSTESTYLWTPSETLDRNDVANPISSAIHTTTYQVMETDIASGCTDVEEITRIVVEPSQIKDWDTTIVIGDIATLPVFGPPVYKYKWSNEKYLSCLDCNYPNAQPLENILYNLEITDIYSCFTSNAKFDITVKPETFVKLPSAFTPNGDSNNDKVYVKGWGIKKLIEFKVFNRWGQEIYSSDDINEGWDGTFKGQQQNSDVYVYKVKVITWKEEEKFVEGYINLIY